MKILFLDIDGVINSYRTAHAMDGFPFDTTPESLIKFDLTAIKLIQRICEDGDIKIVLSSTWRIHGDYKQIGEDLRLPIIDATPIKLSSNRGEEIQMWLDVHPEVIQYIIVDDDSDMLPKQQKRFVKTTMADGLQFHHYQKIRKLFGMKP
jgi:hypothetical protein